MNQQAYKKSFVIGVVAIGVIAGVAAGFFTAHRVMGDMDGMTKETGGVSASSSQAREMKGMSMQQMDMKEMTPADEKSMGGMAGMPGMSAAPSGAVVIPAVARQLIGVRSASAAYATFTQEIRAVGTVGYD